MTKSAKSTSSQPTVKTIRPGQLPYEIRKLRHGTIVTIYDRLGVGKTATVEGLPWCDRHGQESSEVKTSKKVTPIVIPHRCTCPLITPPNRVTLKLKGGRRLELRIIGE